MIGAPSLAGAARMVERARRDAATVCGDERNTAIPVRAAWIEPSALERAVEMQRVWDEAPEAARDAALLRLSAVEASMRALSRGFPLYRADALAAHATGLSAGTVGKWRRRYRGRTPIARLVSLLDARFSGLAPSSWALTPFARLVDAPVAAPDTVAALPVHGPCRAAATAMHGPINDAGTPAAPPAWDRATDAQRSRARRRLDAVDRSDALRAAGVSRAEADAAAALEAGASASAVASWRKRVHRIAPGARVAALLDGERPGRPRAQWREAGAQELWRLWCSDWLREGSTGRGGGVPADRRRGRPARLGLPAARRVPPAIRP